MAHKCLEGQHESGDGSWEVLKDKTIPNRAESIVNLTRSLDKIVGKKRSAQK